jgi:hypothetical protein
VRENLCLRGRGRGARGRCWPGRRGRRRLGDWREHVSLCGRASNNIELVGDCEIGRRTSRVWGQLLQPSSSLLPRL